MVVIIIFIGCIIASGFIGYRAGYNYGYMAGFNYGYDEGYDEGHDDGVLYQVEKNR